MNKLKKVFRTPLGFDLHKNGRQRRLSLVSYASDIPHNLSSQDISYVNYDQHSLTPSHAEHSVKYSNLTSASGQFFNKLHKWAFLGDVGKVKKFMKKIDVNSQDSEGRAALHMAASAGHIEVILILVGARADPELLDRDGRTPFLIAVKRNQIEVVQVFLQYKVNPSVCDNLGNGALHLAAASGGKDIIEVLLDSGLKPDVQNTFDQTPLHVAAENLNVDAVILLVDKGNPVNIPDKEGVTALMLAAKLGSNQLVDLLLNAGADPLMTDGSGWNAPSYAKYSMHEKLEEKLVNTIKSKVKPSSQPQTPVNSSRLSSATPDDSWADSAESLNKQKMTYFTTNLDNSSESSHTLPSKNIQLSSKLSLGPPKPPRQFTSTPNLPDECNTLERSSSDSVAEKKVIRDTAFRSSSKVRRSKSLNKNVLGATSDFERSSKSIHDQYEDRTLGSDVAFDDEEADLPSGVFDKADSLPLAELPESHEEVDTVQLPVPSPMQGCEEMWHSNDQMKLTASLMPHTTNEHDTVGNKSPYNESGYTKMYFGDSQENVYIEIEPLKKESDIDPNMSESFNDSEVLSDILEDTEPNQQHVLSVLRKLRNQLHKERCHRAAQDKILEQSTLDKQALLKELETRDVDFENISKDSTSAKMLLELLQHRSATLEDKASYTLRSLTQTKSVLSAVENEKTDIAGQAAILPLQKPRVFQSTTDIATQVDITKSKDTISVVSIGNQTDDRNNAKDAASQADSPEKRDAAIQFISDKREKIHATADSTAQTDTDTESVGCQTVENRIPTKDVGSQVNEDSQDIPASMKNLLSKHAEDIIFRVQGAVATQREALTKSFTDGQDHLLENIEIIHEKEASQRLQMEEQLKDSNDLDELLNLSRNQSEVFLPAFKNLSQKLDHFDKLLDMMNSLHALMSSENQNKIVTETMGSLMASLSDRILDCITSNMDNVNLKIESLQSRIANAASGEKTISDSPRPCKSPDLIQESFKDLQSKVTIGQAKLETSLSSNFHKTLNTVNETVDENFQIVLDTMQEVEQNILKSLSKSKINSDELKKVEELSEAVKNVQNEVHKITDILDKPGEKCLKCDNIVNAVEEISSQSINTLKSRIDSLHENVSGLEKSMTSLTVAFNEHADRTSSVPEQKDTEISCKNINNLDALVIPKINIVHSEDENSFANPSVIDESQERTASLNLSKPNEFTKDDDEKNNLEIQLIEKSRCFKGLELRLRDLEVDVGELEEELALRNHENIRLRQTVSDQHKQLVDCRQDIARFSELQSKSVSLNKQIRNLENIVSNKQMVIGSLEESLSFAKEENSNLLKSISSLKMNIPQASPQIVEPQIQKEPTPSLQEVQESQLNILYQDIEAKFEKLFASKLNDITKSVELMAATPEPQITSIDVKAREALDLMLERMMDLKNEIVELHSKIELSNRDKHIWMSKYNKIVDRYNRLELEREKSEEVTDSLGDSKNDFSEILKDIETCLKQPYPESKFLMDLGCYSSPDALNRSIEPVSYEPFPVEESEHDSTSMESDLSSINYGSVTTSII